MDAQPIEIPLSSPLEIGTEGQLSDGPKFALNDQSYDAGIMTNSFTFQERGYVADHYVHLLDDKLVGNVETDWPDRVQPVPKPPETRKGSLAKYGDLMVLKDSLGQVAYFSQRSVVEIQSGQLISNTRLPDETGKDPVQKTEVLTRKGRSRHVVSFNPYTLEYAYSNNVTGEMYSAEVLGAQTYISLAVRKDALPDDKLYYKPLVFTDPYVNLRLDSFSGTPAASTLDFGSKFGYMELDMTYKPPPGQTSYEPAVKKFSLYGLVIDGTPVMTTDGLSIPVRESENESLSSLPPQVPVVLEVNKGVDNPYRAAAIGPQIISSSSTVNKWNCFLGAEATSAKKLGGGADRALDNFEAYRNGEKLADMQYGSDPSQIMFSVRLRNSPYSEILQGPVFQITNFSRYERGQVSYQGGGRRYLYMNGSVTPYFSEAVSAPFCNELNLINKVASGPSKAKVIFDLATKRAIANYSTYFFLMTKDKDDKDAYLEWPEELVDREGAKAWVMLEDIGGIVYRDVIINTSVDTRKIYGDVSQVNPLYGGGGFEVELSKESNKEVIKIRYSMRYVSVPMDVISGFGSLSYQPLNPVRIGVPCYGHGIDSKGTLVPMSGSFDLVVEYDRGAWAFWGYSFGYAIADRGYAELNTGTAIRSVVAADYAALVLSSYLEKPSQAVADWEYVSRQFAVTVGVYDLLMYADIDFYAKSLVYNQWRTVVTRERGFPVSGNNMPCTAEVVSGTNNLQVNQRLIITEGRYGWPLSYVDANGDDIDITATRCKLIVQITLLCASVYYIERLDVAVSGVSRLYAGWAFTVEDPALLYMDDTEIKGRTRFDGIECFMSDYYTDVTTGTVNAEADRYVQKIKPITIAIEGLGEIKLSITSRHTVNTIDKPLFSKVEYVYEIADSPDFVSPIIHADFIVSPDADPEDPKDVKTITAYIGDHTVRNLVIRYPHGYTEGVLAGYTPVRTESDEEGNITVTFQGKFGDITLTGGGSFTDPSRNEYDADGPYYSVGYEVLPNGYHRFDMAEDDTFIGMVPRIGMTDRVDSRWSWAGESLDKLTQFFNYTASSSTDPVPSGKYFLFAAKDAESVLEVRSKDVLKYRGEVTQYAPGDEYTLEKVTALWDEEEEADNMMFDRSTLAHSYWAVSRDRCLSISSQFFRMIENGKIILSVPAGDIFYAKGALVTWGVSSCASGLAPDPFLWCLFLNGNNLDFYAISVLDSKGDWRVMRPVNEWEDNGGVKFTVKTVRNYGSTPETSNLTVYSGISSSQVAYGSVFSSANVRGIWYIGIKYDRGMHQWRLNMKQQSVFTGFGSVGPDGLTTGNFLPKSFVNKSDGFKESVSEGNIALDANEVINKDGTLYFCFRKTDGYVWGVDGSGQLLKLSRMQNTMEYWSASGTGQVDGATIARSVSTGIGSSRGVARVFGVDAHAGFFHWSNTYLTGYTERFIVRKDSVDKKHSVVMRPDPLTNAIFAMAGIAGNSLYNKGLQLAEDRATFEMKKDAEKNERELEEAEKKAVAAAEKRKAERAIKWKDLDEKGKEDRAQAIAEGIGSVVGAGLGSAWNALTGLDKDAGTITVAYKSDCVVYSDIIPCCHPTQYVFSTPGTYSIQTVRKTRKYFDVWNMAQFAGVGYALNMPKLVSLGVANATRALSAAVSGGSLAGPIPGVIAGAVASVAEGVSTVFKGTPTFLPIDIGPGSVFNMGHETWEWAGSQHIYIQGPSAKNNTVTFLEGSVKASPKVKLTRYPQMDGQQLKQITWDWKEESREIDASGPWSVIVGSAGPDQKGLTETSDPVFTDPGIYDHCVLPKSELYVTAIGDSVVHVSIRDTKIIDGPFSNVVVDGEDTLIASPYLVVRSNLNVRASRIKPKAVTSGLMWHSTGYNFIDGLKMVHAFDGYSNRIIQWVGVKGGDVEKLNQLSQYIKPELSRTIHSMYPPTAYFGGFTGQPAIDYPHTVIFNAIDMQLGPVLEDTQVFRVCIPVFFDKLANFPTGVQSVASYKLLVTDGITSLTTDTRSTDIRNYATNRDFFIMGQVFRQSDEYFSQIVQKMGVQDVQDITPAIGLKYIGTYIKDAWFYTRSTRNIWRFTGSNTLETMMSAYRIKDITAGEREFLKGNMVVWADFVDMGKRLVRFTDQPVGTIPNPHEYIVNPTLAGSAAGLVIQGDNVEAETIADTREAWVQVAAYTYDENMLEWGGVKMAAQSKKWKKVKGDTLDDFWNSERVYDMFDLPRGYYHNPFRLATSYQGVSDSVDCQFEWETVFAFTEWMHEIIGDRYVTVFLAAEMALPGGHKKSEVTKVRLCASMFQRTEGYTGYYTFRFNARLGAGNRERMFIWSDGLIALRSWKCFAQQVTDRRASPLLTAPDFKGMEEF
jgi:hypothetical protein